MSQACEMAFNSLGCNEFAANNPEPEVQSKIEFCPIACKFEGNQFSASDCAAAFPASWWDDIKSIFTMFDAKMDTETFLRYNAFIIEDCRSPECKYKNLGPMAKLFEKHEIEGDAAARAKYDCGDHSARRACEGMSMESLYRQIEKRARPHVRSGQIAPKWKPPWLQGREVYVLKEDKKKAEADAAALEPDRPLQQFADETLGVRVGCYTREARTHLMCYAMAMAIDPVGLLKLAQKTKRITGISKEKLIARLEARQAMKEMKLKYPQRYGFLELFHDKLATTPKQNQTFIDAAHKSNTGSSIVMYTDNYKQKDLNKTMKAVVTAMNNKRDEIFLEEASALLERFPNVERLPYSDYKAVSQRFSAKPPAKSLPPNFENELAEMNMRALEKLRKYAVDNKIVDEDPSEWFRTGFGDTVGEAADTAREMRNRSSRDTANFNDPSILKMRNESLRNITRYQKQIALIFKGTPIMRDKLITRGPDFLKKEVFELYRKYPEPENFNRVMRDRYSLKADDSELATIRNYIDEVNTFSPPILVAKRKVVTLNDAYHGGLSIDFAGQGGANLYSTAQALSTTQNSKQALDITRLEEFHETRDFLAKQDVVRQKIEEVLTRHKSTARIDASGDDMVVKFDQKLKPEVIQEINVALVEAVSPSALRITQAAPAPTGVKAFFAGSRTIDDISVHGENIEKAARVILEGKIPKSRLDEVGLLIDMTDSKAPALVRTSRVKLSDKEISEINEAFAAALIKTTKKSGK
jgi:hypothetical protein